MFPFRLPDSNFVLAEVRVTSVAVQSTLKPNQRSFPSRTPFKNVAQVTRVGRGQKPAPNPRYFPFVFRVRPWASHGDKIFSASVIDKRSAWSKTSRGTQSGKAVMRER